MRHFAEALDDDDDCGEMARRSLSIKPAMPHMKLLSGHVSLGSCAYLGGTLEELRNKSVYLINTETWLGLTLTLTLILTLTLTLTLPLTLSLTLTLTLPLTLPLTLALTLTLTRPARLVARHRVPRAPRAPRQRLEQVAGALEAAARPLDRAADVRRERVQPRRVEVLRLVRVRVRLGLG